MIKGVENILKWYTMQDMPYWRIANVTKENEGGNYIADSGLLSEDKDRAKQDGYNSFSMALELLEPGQYRIIVRNSPTQAKSLAMTIYKHGEIPMGVAGHSSASVSGFSTPNVNTDFVSKTDAKQMANEAAESALLRFQYFMALEKVATLERELNRVQREANTEHPISGIIKRLDPFIDPMMSHLFPKQAAMQTTQIAAVGYADTNNEVDLDKSKKLKALLEKWQDLDQENFVEVIEKVVDTAEKDAVTYAMYRKMLIGV